MDSIVDYHSSCYLVRRSRMRVRIAAFRRGWLARNAKASNTSLALLCMPPAHSLTSFHSVPACVTMTTLASLTAWNPSISESNDGEPLVTSLSDFGIDFPHDRLPKNNAWLAAFLRLEVVLASILFYLISEPLLQAITKRTGMTGTCRIFKTAVAVHNLALAVFSLVVAVNAWQTFFSHYAERGWMATYCDPDGEFWKSGNGTWSIIFYLSKYWEFIDTWILVIKVRTHVL